MRCNAMQVFSGLLLILKSAASCFSLDILKKLAVLPPLLPHIKQHSLWPECNFAVVLLSQLHKVVTR